MPDEDHVAQILGVQHRDDVPDVQVEIDLAAQQVCPLAETGQRRRIDLVARGSQQSGYALIAPAPVPAAVHQYVGRHGSRLPRST